MNRNPSAVRSQTRPRARTLLHLLGVALALLPLLSSVRPARAQLPTATPTPLPDPLLTGGPAAGPLYAPGELLVSVRQPPGQGASAAFAQSVVPAAGAQAARSFDLSSSDGDRTTYRLTVPVGREYEVAAQMARDPAVAWVSPNWMVWAAQEVPPTPVDSAAVDAGLVEPGFAVDDPFYAARQWNMQRIEAARAWQMAFELELADQESDVVVAVIDSGIDRAHPDFVGRLQPGRNYIEEDLNGDGFLELDPGNLTDRCGHGTHIAGIIAAGLNDAVGVAGVAPNVQIDARRTLSSAGGSGCGGTVFDVANAIIDAAADGADIINMSLVIAGDEPAIREAIEFAAGRGAVLVAAAGNSGINQVYYPAAYPEVIGVAALGIDDRRTYYSNYGSAIALAAPGGTLAEPVFSAWSQDAFYTVTVGSAVQTIYRCANRQFSGGGEYCTQYGTSQATPAVAGVAALLLSINPKLTAPRLRSILTQTAAPLDEGPEFVGAGKLDALAAVRTQRPSALQIVPSSLITTALNTADPFTLTVRLDNPSLAPMRWGAQFEPSLTAAAGGSLTSTLWITLTSGSSNAQTGSVRYGEPDFITLLVSPTVAMTGSYGARLAFTATTSSGPVAEEVGLLVKVVEGPINDRGRITTYLPMVMGGAIFSANIPFAWATPADASTRMTLALTDTSTVDLTSLPPGLTLHGEPATNVRVYSDGFLSLVGPFSAPAPPFAPEDPRCLPSTPYPDDAVFGWWADLDPSAAGARVSAFPLGSDRYVVEFWNVPARGVKQPYRVSFQIVLHQNGAVRLNYRAAPHFVGAPEPYAIGVEARAARFYALVGCAVDGHIVGEQPRAGQSFLIRAEEIF